MNASPVDPLGAGFAECPLHDSDDIQEVARIIVDPASLSLTLLGNLKSPGVSTDMLRAAVA